jgi:hypothetical protein
VAVAPVLVYLLMVYLRYLQTLMVYLLVAMYHPSVANLSVGQYCPRLSSPEIFRHFNVKIENVVMEEI